MRPYCVGLTGGIGAGKTLVSDRFAQLGAGVVDTDLIARELTAPGGAAMDPLVAAFGGGIVAPDGGLDRAVMSGLVFSDALARRRLESILHPMIRTEAERKVMVSDVAYVLLVVPLLVEHLAEYRSLIDRVLLVDCDESLQLQRAISRSGMDEARVRAVMASQASRTERLAWADDVIDNNAEPVALHARVHELHGLYLVLASASRGSSTPNAH